MPTRAFLKTEEAPLRFSPETQAVLRLALKRDSARLIPLFEALANDHRRPAQGIVFTPSRRGADPIDREVRTLAAALLRLVKLVDGASPRLRARLGGVSALGALAGLDMNQWVPLQATRNLAAEVLAGLPKPLVIRTSGRPRKEAQHSLAFEVALVLSLSKVRVSKNRDGQFGQVLREVAGEVYGASFPQELFPLIQEAADSVNELTPNMFLWLVPYLHNPAFWQRWCGNPAVPSALSGIDPGVLGETGPLAGGAAGRSMCGCSGSARAASAVAGSSRTGMSVFVSGRVRRRTARRPGACGRKPRGAGVTVTTSRRTVSSAAA